MEQKSLANRQDFINPKDAEKILHNSRKEIDQINNELVDLIQKRTSLAKNIVLSKLSLNMNIIDSKREKLIYENLEKIANERNLDQNTKDSVFEIMDILMNLSKEVQKDIIDNND